MTVAESLPQVLAIAERAACKSSRSLKDIVLVAVSKKQPIALMREYMDVAQSRALPVIFGENYVQELKIKRAEFSPDVAFHLLGPLQSNKIRDAVRYADVIQSVHSESVLNTIAVEAKKLGKRQSVFIQVNIGNDPAKSGFKPEQVQDVLQTAQRFNPEVIVSGLMTITPYYEDPELARADFIRMRKLREALLGTAPELCPENGLKLSMGMSADYHIALEEGADIVRIGTAIFGERLSAV